MDDPGRGHVCVLDVFRREAVGEWTVQGAECLKCFTHTWDARRTGALVRSADGDVRWRDYQRIEGTSRDALIEWIKAHG